MEKTTTPKKVLTRDERVAKLPTWAQEELKDLQRERDIAVRTLNEFVDNSTPSHFYVEEMTCIGEGGGPSTKRSYVQTSSITVEAHGIFLRISTAYGNTNESSIVLSWEDAARRSGEVAFIPLSYQQARLVAHDKMRT